MPRYFFDVHDGVDTRDEEGTILPGIAEAKDEAARFAGGLLRDDHRRFWNGDEWTVRVRDETNLTLFELTFFGILAPILTGAKA